MKKLISLVLLISLCACSSFNSKQREINLSKNDLENFRNSEFEISYYIDKDQHIQISDSGEFLAEPFECVNEMNNYYLIHLEKELKDGYHIEVSIDKNSVSAFYYYDDGYFYSYSYEKGEETYRVYSDDGDVDCSSKPELFGERVCETKKEKEALKDFKKTINKELKKLKYSKDELIELGKLYNEEVIKKRVKELLTADIAVTIKGDGNPDDGFNLHQTIIINHDKDKVTKIVDKLEYKISASLEDKDLTNDNKNRLYNKERGWRNYTYSSKKDMSERLKGKKGVEYSYQKQGDNVTIEITLDLNVASISTIEAYSVYLTEEQGGPVSLNYFLDNFDYSIPYSVILIQYQ